MARGALLAATACGGVAASLLRMKPNPRRNGQERAAALHRAAQVRGGNRTNQLKIKQLNQAVSPDVVVVAGPAVLVFVHANDTPP